jgi:hypothetical protein
MFVRISQPFSKPPCVLAVPLVLLTHGVAWIYNKINHNNLNKTKIYTFSR